MSESSHSEESAVDTAKQTDETPSGESGDVAGQWVDPKVDYLGLMEEMRAKWGNPDAAVDGKLDAIEKAVEAMVEQSYALARRSIDDDVADLLHDGDAETVQIEIHVEEEEVRISDAQWSRRIELLYDDVLYLFHCGDKEGALISLERLLLIAPKNADVQRFISVNEKKLLEVYQDVLGSFKLVPERAKKPQAMPAGHEDNERFKLVMKHVNGENSIETLFEILPWSPLESCATLSQLQRCGMVNANSLENYI
jgi:hypothetical protein